jgi:hypothetical protein
MIPDQRCADPDAAQAKQPVRSNVLEEAVMGFAAPASEMQKCDVEVSVIGHGTVEDPFIVIDGLDIERDPDFPVRVMVQIYKATSNGIVG